MVETRAECDEQNLVITVIDDGMGFKPRNDSPGVGLGMPTIAALATTLSVVTPETGGTEMWMVFAAHP
jgi:signal transduction histidine kinase